MNLANQLTILRVAMVPFFMYFLLLDTSWGRIVALVLFVVASLTDMLDGYIARHYNQITKLGKLMDPLADKILVTAALVCFVDMHLVPAWIVVLIISREFIVSIFRAIAASEGVVIAASTWGKFKTISQMVAIILILLDNYPFALWHVPMDQIVLYIAAVLTLISGVDYIYQNKSLLKE